MIRVTVKPYAELEKYNRKRGEKFSVELGEGSTVRDLMDLIDLPGHEVTLILRNGKRANMEEVLDVGDEIRLYPPVAGG